MVGTGKEVEKGNGELFDLKSIFVCMKLSKNNKKRDSKKFKKKSSFQYVSSDELSCRAGCLQSLLSEANPSTHRQHSLLMRPVILKSSAQIFFK